MEHVVLVDGEDNDIGTEEKYAAHRYPAKLHRAFSVFILNDKNQLLITKRNKEKKTWPGFWSNTVCSHPRLNEPVILGAQRRLEEEMGFTCDLDFLFKFQYDAKYDKDWGEHELDHVFIGHYNGQVKPNPGEIDDIAFVDLEDLKKDIELNSGKYTPWFKMCLKRFLNHVGRN